MTTQREKQRISNHSNFKEMKEPVGSCIISDVKTKTQTEEYRKYPDAEFIKKKWHHDL